VEEAGTGSMISHKLGVDANSNNNVLEYVVDACGGQVGTFFVLFQSIEGSCNEFCYSIIYDKYLIS
jgi:hypothetical protein